MAQKDGNAKTEKYIYGVVRKSAHAGVKGKGVRRSPVQIIAEDDVAVVASDIEASDELEAGRDELMAHSQVLERAIEGGTILPMRFGIVMPNESSVRDDLLAPYREELESQLAEFDGKVEINLKGMYDEDAI